MIVRDTILACCHALLNRFISASLRPLSPLTARGLFTLAHVLRDA